MIQIPDDAHPTFECPFCKMKGVTTALTTRLATNITQHGARLRFTGIQCSTCSKQLTFEATYIGPTLPLSNPSK